MEKRIFVQDLTETNEKEMDEENTVENVELPECKMMTEEPITQPKTKQIKKVSVICQACGTRVIAGPDVNMGTVTCPVCGGVLIAYKRPAK